MYNREEFLAHYHKRSNVETAFSMIKAKFGDAVRSKSDIGQLNGDCSSTTGFSPPVHDEVRRESVDGLRLGLHATYPAPGVH